MSLLGSLAKAVVQGLTDIDTQHATNVQAREVEVIYTLNSEGRSEMWTEKYKTLSKLVEDYKFFSRYNSNSIIKVLMKNTDQVIGVYQVNKQQKSVITITGPESFNQQLLAQLHY